MTPEPAATVIPASAAAPPRLTPVLRAFALDVLIAAAVMLALSMLAGLGWALWRGVQLGLQAGATGEPAQVLKQMGQPGALATILMTLFGTGGTALLLYFTRRRADAAERAASWHAISRLSTWGWVGATTLAVFTVSATMSTLATGLHIDITPTNQPLIESSMALHPLLLGLFAVLLAPAYEELLFRRVLFGRLWRAGRPGLGMALSAMLFALLHELPGSSGNGVAATGVLWLSYGFMGVAFAWVYRRTGSLWAAYAAHALNNGAALLLLGAQ